MMDGDAAGRIAELEAELAARDLFIATIGHELRNPMVPIVLSVDRLERLAANRDWARVAESLPTLVAATEAFMRRATQLLDVTRLSRETPRIAGRAVPLGEVMRDLALRHRETARRAQCELRVDDADVVAHGDREAIDQILDNLLLNAFKYGAGRPVAVGARQVGRVAAIGVRDRGEGIPADQQTRIFALFGRGPNPHAPGLGVGLFVASRLAAAMGGTIAVTSAPGQGAEFRLELSAAAEGDG